jgi:hypothetical protein
VAFVNAHPGLASVAGGVGFGLLLLAGGGWSRDPINVLGALTLGAVFAFAMFRGIRSRR